jgi:hypothetical protein
MVVSVELSTEPWDRACFDGFDRDASAAAISTGLEEAFVFC